MEFHFYNTCLQVSPCLRAMVAKKSNWRELKRNGMQGGAGDPYNAEVESGRDLALFSSGA
jgi:hypothetical protein